MKPSLEDLALWRKNKLDKMHLKNEGEVISLSYLMIFLKIGLMIFLMFKAIGTVQNTKFLQESLHALL